MIGLILQCIMEVMRSGHWLVGVALETGEGVGGEGLGSRLRVHVSLRCPLASANETVRSGWGYKLET